jgi:hypothetical protein
LKESEALMMTLFDYYLQYMGEICDGKRAMPTVENPASDIPAFVRACAAQDGKTLAAELFAQFSMADAVAAAQTLAGQAVAAGGEPAAESSVEHEGAAQAAAGQEATSGDEAADVDRDKHPFEVLLDCVALDDNLVQYLIEILKNGDKTAFFKLSKVTTGLDLDPAEFLFWLAHRELYASEEERFCATVMDACMARLADEKRLEVLAALLSGDQETFEVFRCEAPELVHLPAATYEWFCRNYLDRDYPIRFLMRRSGVPFPG